MSDFGSAVQPYDLEKAVAADRGDDCIILDVGRTEDGQPVCSFKHVLAQVERHLVHADTPPCAAKKLYIIGDWILTEPVTEQDVNLDPQAKDVEVSDPS